MNRLDIQTALHYEKVRTDLIKTFSEKINLYQQYLIDSDNRQRRIEELSDIHLYEKFMHQHKQNLIEYPKRVSNYKEYLEILKYYD